MDKMIKRLWPCLLLFTACGHDCKESTLPCHKSIIFLDKSISVNGQDARLAAGLEATLNPFLESVISNPGDMVEARLIHGQSIGAKTLFQKTWREQPPCEDGMGPDSYIQEKEEYQIRLRKFRSAILNELLDRLDQTSKAPVTLETDLLGTLEIISDSFKDKNASEKGVVLYISDMVHSKKAPRDYHKHPPKDRAESEECAKKDLVWLEGNHKVDASKFENLEIKVWFTGLENADTKNEQMRYYWSALFEDLNKTVKVHFE